MKNNSNLLRKILPVAAILFAISGILGVTDSKNYDYSDFQWERGNKTIIKTDKDAPAEKAGFQLDDLVVKADWVSMDDSKEWNGYQLTHVGETRVYEIERSGISQVKKLTFTLRTTKDKILNYLATLLGFPDYDTVN
jgi:C-terminal processing protease CtpA/Prc